MSSVHNSVETVNAAATAIVAAESRVQPSTTVQKRRWGSCWSIYSCFGKQSKRIGHAVLLSEPGPPRITPPPISENRTHSSTIVLPFIAPPSSPASFLQSDPPSATHSPGGLLSLSIHSSGGPTAQMFAIGPYAHETQLVSPPVFSTFTTEPSTASFTPPPEPVQMTTPSSPEVPFAELLSSSLARSRRNSGSHMKYPLSEYEFQPYKWDSRVGSGSLTPNEWGSRLGSGALTPNSAGPPSRDNKILENQIYEVASLANSDRKSQNDDIVDHRVSFELFGEDIPTCIVRAPSLRNACGYLPEKIAEGTKKDSTSKNADSFREHFNGENVNEEELLHHKNRTISLGSSKDFNFNNAKEEEVPEKSSIDCEWWTNEKVTKKEIGPRNSWSFFPMLQSGAS